MQGLEKIIDLLKTGGWQSFFIALSLFVFLRLQSVGVIDTSAVPYLAPIVWLLAIVFSGIAVASLGDQIKHWLQERRKRRLTFQAREARRKAFVEDIDRLTDKEREILGYLLSKNQKRFDADSTGDHASSLIAKGYINLIARPGMHYHINSFPFEVADYVWEEMQARRERFPYHPRSVKVRGGEVAPWIDTTW